MLRPAAIRTSPYLQLRAILSKSSAVPTRHPNTTRRLMSPQTNSRRCRLGDASRRFRGRIVALAAPATPGPLPGDELERRLAEMGFVEGAEVELRHQGLFRADPIAVLVNGVMVALRRREARAILVEAQA